MPKVRGINGQLAQTLPGSRKDRIRNRGDDDGGSWLAHPAGSFCILGQVHLDGRRLVHAQNPVGVEVGLFDASVLQGALFRAAPGEAAYQAEVSSSCRRLESRLPLNASLRASHVACVLLTRVVRMMRGLSPDHRHSSHAP